jgi:hypothetical protein
MSSNVFMEAALWSSEYLALGFTMDDDYAILHAPARDHCRSRVGIRRILRFLTMIATHNGLIAALEKSLTFYSRHWSPTDMTCWSRLVAYFEHRMSSIDEHQLSIDFLEPNHAVRLPSLVPWALLLHMVIWSLKPGSQN